MGATALINIRPASTYEKFHNEQLQLRELERIIVGHIGSSINSSSFSPSTYASANSADKSN